MAPLVSIGMPTYNQASYLSEALASVLGQSFTDFEVVLVDDASTDDTPRVLASVHDPRVRLFRNPANKGWVGNFRRVLAESRGKYFLLLGHDDLLAPGFLAWAVGVLEANPTAAFAHSGVRFIGNRQDQSVLDFPQKLNGRDYILQSLAAAQNLTNLSASLARRDWVMELGIEDLIFCDWTLWLRLAMRGEVLYTPELLGSYRFHSANETKTVSSQPSRHLWELGRSVLTFAARENADAAMYARVYDCLDRLYSRYIGYLGRNHDLSWGQFFRELKSAWRSPARLVVKLRESGRAILHRFLPARV